MKIIKFDTDGREIMFVCRSRDTRNGFAHDADLFVNGCCLGSGHAYYLNRTWERYSYETACLSCCSDLIDRRVARLKDDLKADRGWKCLSASRRAELAAVVDADDRVKLLRGIKNVLRTEEF